MLKPSLQSVRNVLIVTLLLANCSRQAENERSLDEIANKYVEVLTKEKNIKAFSALYSDSVLYSDPVWGATDIVTLDTLKHWFAPVFDPTTGWDFEIITVAKDFASSTFAIKGFSTDLATGERRLITSWYKVEQGKIKEQTDLSPWSLKSLKYSPRFKEALKDWPD